MKKMIGILILIITVPVILIGITQILTPGDIFIDILITFLFGCLPAWGGLNLIKSYNEKKHNKNLQSKNNLTEQNRRGVSTTEDDFATFTISTGYSHEKSKNKTPGKWLNSTESITIKGKLINKGFFYYGGILKSLDGYSIESSLVDDKLKIQDTEITYSDSSLGYWPQFNSISPKCRGAYINWLASDRDNKNTPIGYVFVYFYGLERRILVDENLSDKEYIELFSEIERIRGIYQDNRSFFNYSSRLIEFMCLSRPNIVSISDDNTDFLSWNDSLLFKHKLATCVVKGEPITPELALLWLRNYPEYNLKTPARRCSSEFSDLFKYNFTEKYNNNFIVKPNKTKLRISYFPASSSIRGIDIEQQDLPDPSILKGPVKKLIEIAEQCTNELESYSRYMGKKDSSPEDVSALLLLPDKIQNKHSSILINKIKNIGITHIETHKGLISFKKFWSLSGMPIPEKINKKELDIIVKLSEKAGFGLAPDYRYHSAKPSLDGSIVLFKEGHGKYFESSSLFNEVGMILQLGVIVAKSDAKVDQVELDYLEDLIEHNTNLSPTEKRSLHAYLSWRLNSPINMSGLKKALEKIDQHGKAAVSKVLINIALIDGKIDPEEIKQLEKIYTALGIDKKLVTSDIHNISSRNKKPIEKNNEYIESKSSKEKKTTFRLNSEVLAHHENETKNVQDILSSIFVEEAPDVIDVKKNQDSSLTHGNLDKKHNSLYEKLITREKWERREIETLCNDLGIMMDGAIETINDWSYEKIDAPLIDDDEYIFIDKEIVEELVG